MSLFANNEKENLAAVQPLAARMRPRSLDEFAGQKHFLGEGKLLRRLITADKMGRPLVPSFSMVRQGPAKQVWLDCLPIPLDVALCN